LTVYQESKIIEIVFSEFRMENEMKKDVIRKIIFIETESLVFQVPGERV